MISRADLIAEIDQLRSRIAGFEAASVPATMRMEDAHMVLDHINDAVVVVDANLLILLWNRAAEVIYGWTAEEMIGRRMRDVMEMRYVGGVTRQDVMSALHETGYWRGEAFLTRRDGSELAVEGSSRVFRDDQGAMAGIITVARDITERSQAAAERERLLALERAAREEAEPANRRLRVLVDASHDFLSAGLGVRDILDRITQRVAELIKDLCVLSLLSPDGSYVVEAATYHANPEALALLRAVLTEETLRVGEGLQGTVAQTGMPLFLPVVPLATIRPRLKAAYRRYVDRFGLSSLIIVPLRAHGRVIGTMLLSRDAPDYPYTTADQDLLQDLADRAGQIVWNAQLFAAEQAARQQAEAAQARLAILAKASQIFADASLDLDTVLDQITRHIADVIGDACGIRLLSADERALETTSFYHPNPRTHAILHPILFNTPMPADAGPYGQVIATKQPLTLSRAELRAHVPPQALAYVDRFLPHSTLIVPLFVRGRSIGTLTIVRDESARSFTPADELMIGDLAERAAVAIENTRLYQTAQTVSREKSASLALLNTLFAAAPIGLAFHDSNLRFAHINENLAEMNGLPAAEHIGKRIAEILPELGPILEPMYRRVLATGKAIRDVEIHGTTRARPGVSRDWLASYYPVHSQDGTIIGVGTVITEVTERKQAENELQSYTQQLQLLSRRLVEVQETERRHLARELHDEIGQMLTGLNLLLEPRRPGVDAELSDRLEAAQTLIMELTSRVRQLSLDLRPSMLDDFGLLATLRWHVERYTAHTQIAVDFKHVGLDLPIDPQIAVTAYRIVQEALTNVARYAQVSSVSLRAWRSQHTLSVEIEDQGHGFDLEAVLRAGNSSGIAGMRERVRLLDGVIHIVSEPGMGTRVLVELPLEQSEHVQEVTS
ncbi:MAG TPA: PAS domain-containing protein [Herpetosiphonaceae bacterium]